MNVELRKRVDDEWERIVSLSPVKQADEWAKIIGFKLCAEDAMKEIVEKSDEQKTITFDDWYEGMAQGLAEASGILDRHLSKLTEEEQKP